VASVAALWVPQWGVDTLARQAGPIYAALLITFFSGVRWGACLNAVAVGELLLGLVPPYAAWIALILRPEFALCILLIILLLQALAVKLGVVTGRDLAQACRDYYSKPVSIVLWVLCEIAIAACDLAEVIGSAIALTGSSAPDPRSPACPTPGSNPAAP